MSTNKEPASPSPIQPFEGPALWRGGELAERSDWQHTLSEGECQEIRAALESTQRDEVPLQDITVKNFLLPTLAGQLGAAQNSLEHGCGSFLMRGWPVGEHTLEGNRRVFWGLSQYLGTPISQSAQGEKIFHVQDAGLSKGDSRVRGPNTRRALNFHCDRCDVIGFLCIHQAKKGGESYLVSSPAIHNEMLRHHPDLLALLYQSWYYKTHNVDLANDDLWCFQPVFAQVEGRFVSYILRVLIDRAYQLPELPDMTRQQKKALDTLDALCTDPSFHYSFTQEPGDMLFVNNFTNFHSRGAFENHDDPARHRLLLRIWLSVPNSRPLPQSFSGSFGQTLAGSLRGGIHPAS
ncbi:MAG: TauD/TfdA family dioxygenase [Deltaproteobacteria bacterium]|nr:TauD/TfdA family dioxygenase [Deltaproteobacteria bacterium]